MRRFSYITGRERTAIAAAAAAVVIGLGVMIFAGKGGKTGLSAAKDSTAQRGTPKAMLDERGNGKFRYDEGGGTAELFSFDPNTADSTQLLRLGLSPWQVRSIYRYRNKGGIFRRKTDFARVYGLTKGQYKRLEPYINIGEDYAPARKIYDEIDKKLYVRDTVKYPLKLKEGEHVSINAADTAQLRRVPGIGRHFSREIVHYRNRLGGYYSVRQLLEIDGFPEESLPYFVVGEPCFSRININKATLSQLRQHPYINYYLARTITEHRRLHGRINSLDDLKLYRDFTSEVIKRLESYVEF